MIVKPAIPGMGFDVNQTLTGNQADAFKAAGYSFAIRYLPRTESLIPGNLSRPEIQAILGVGLALMVVQHVAKPGWEPSLALGTSYGSYAATYAEAIGLPKGVNIWLDLEEVAIGSSVKEVTDYCTAWFTAVSAAGYIPGLYVGWGVVLSDQELYDLPFKHYWRAYNCDQNIPVRGYQLIQEPQKTLAGITFDPDRLQADELGDVPFWVVAD